VSCRRRLLGLIRMWSRVIIFCQQAQRQPDRFFCKPRWWLDFGGKTRGKKRKKEIHSGEIARQSEKSVLSEANLAKWVTMSLPKRALPQAKQEAIVAGDPTQMIAQSYHTFNVPCQDTMSYCPIWHLKGFAVHSGGIIPVEIAGCLRRKSL
jgi:hypothetical protein